MALPAAARRLATLGFTEWRLGVERMLADLDNRVARLGASRYEQPEWITLSMTGWTHFDARLVQYAGVGPYTIMRGLAKSTGGVPGAAVVANLPGGFRPELRVPYDVYQPAVSNNAFGQISITGDGNIRIEVGSTVWISFDAVRFPRVPA